jgi:hypothetical protein
MSAWEGSEWQRQNEERKEIRRKEIAKVQQDNPWLSPADCERWVDQQEQERIAKQPKLCCVCCGRRPGIIRRASTINPPYTLGVCECVCHESTRRLR